MDDYYLALMRHAPKDLVFQAYHDWNTVFVYSSSSLQIAMIDVTLYDTSKKKRSLDALDAEHINTSNDEWKYRFHKQLKKFEILKRCMLID